MSEPPGGRATRATDGGTSGIDVKAALHGILKRYDRIGFGRRGVLDAQQDIQRLAAGLSPADRARLGEVIQQWIDTEEAERLAAPLHYNLPEHIQALAIRLCASLPIPESLPLLRRLDAENAFASASARMCRDALYESLTRLSRLR